MITNPKRGDLISFNRAKIVDVQVLNVPGVGGEDYILIIDGKTFTFSGDEGASLNAVAQGLVEVLLAEQTAWSVTHDGLAGLVGTGPLIPVTGGAGIKGPSGENQTVSSSDNLQVTILQEAYADSRSADSSFARILETWAITSRTQDLGIIQDHRLRVRRLNTGDVFEAMASQVPTLVARAEDVP